VARLCRRCVASENNRQPLFAGADDHDFRIATQSEFFGRFDSFLFQKIFVDAFGHNFLKTGDAFGFDFLALGFLFLF